MVAMLPLKAAILVAQVSISSLSSSAFVCPDATGRSSTTAHSASPSLLPILASSSIAAPIAACPSATRWPSARAPHGRATARQGPLSAASSDAEPGASGPPPSNRVAAPVIQFPSHLRSDRAGRESKEIYQTKREEAEPRAAADRAVAVAVAARTPDLKELASRIDTKASRRPAPRATAAPGATTGAARPRYQLGVGKNMPLSNSEQVAAPQEDLALNWNVPENPNGNAARLAGRAPEPERRRRYDAGVGKHAPLASVRVRYDDDGDEAASRRGMRTTKRLLPKGDEESAKLTKAVWDEGHFDDRGGGDAAPAGEGPAAVAAAAPNTEPLLPYQQIDLSVPPSVYSLGAAPPGDAARPVDAVWDLMRREAHAEAAREPLLVSFLYSTILNHPTLESALAFHLANRLSSPAMLSTQIMSLIQQALEDDPDFRRSLRADVLAVRDRDPACNCLPDVFLYFKGFHALQTHRVAHYLWRSGRRVLAHYLQSQVSATFQIDIHPNATLGSGIMLDHGTGIVIGETAHLGHNCSVLHHVTLGGSGRAGCDRHPKIGNGVLLGAGSSVLGNIRIGDGCQVGAGTLVIEDLPPRSVAVGVPAKVIGRFVDVTAQPSIGMNQLGSKEAEEDIVLFGMDGI